MKAPWFPFYCGDFLASSDVQLMEAHEVGAYVLLLTHSWQSDRPGYLPNDEGRLRRLARLSTEAWKDSRELLLSKWLVTEDAESRFNPRLLKEAGKQVELRELKAEAGRKSAERRAQQATERQQKPNTNPTGVENPATGVGQNGNYSQPQSQPQSQEGKPSSSLRSEEDAASAAASAPEKKIEPEPTSKSLTIAPQTEGGAVDAPASIKLTKQRGGKQLMADTPLADYAAFAAAWDAAAAANPATYADFTGVNLPHYHAALLDWSTANGQKKNDWLATIRGSVRRDADEGKLRKAGVVTSQANHQANAVHRSTHSYGTNAAAARLQTPTPDASNPNAWGIPAYVAPAGAATLPGGN